MSYGNDRGFEAMPTSMDDAQLAEIACDNKQVHEGHVYHKPWIPKANPADVWCPGVTEYEDYKAQKDAIIAKEREPYDALLAEVTRLRAIVAAVEALPERWGNYDDNGDIGYGDALDQCVAELSAALGGRP